MCLLDFVVTLNGCSHDLVNPQLLNFHFYSELPDPDVFSEEEVQHAVVDLRVRMKLDILAHVIKIFRLFWSNSFVQLMVVVQLILMRDE